MTEQMKRPGFQVMNIKTSNLDNGPAYVSLEIELQGLRFGGIAMIKPEEDGDIFAKAQRRAIRVALDLAEHSDMQLYGRAAGGNGGGGGYRRGGNGGQGGGGRPPQNPTKPASEGQVKRVFGVAKDHGYSWGAVRGKIQELGWNQDALTVGQCNELVAYFGKNPQGGGDSAASGGY